MTRRRKRLSSVIDSCFALISSHMLAPTAVACYLLLAGTTDAFQFRQCSRCPHLRQQQFKWQRQTTTRLIILQSNKNENDEPSTSWPQCTYRRKFLSTFSTAALLIANVVALYPEETRGAMAVDEGISITADGIGADVTARKLDELVKDGMVLDADIIKIQEELRKSINEEKRLIDELSKEIPDLDEIKRDTIKLIIDEEHLKMEMEYILVTMERMGSDLRGINSDVEILRGRVAEKRGLIARLKWQSERRIDPKTGKYMSMSPDEYKGKLTQPVIPFEYMQYLKDSMKSDEQFERNLVDMRGIVESLGRRYVKLFHKIHGLIVR